jgi:hypothetical protein
MCGIAMLAATAGKAAQLTQFGPHPLAHRGEASQTTHIGAINPTKAHTKPAEAPLSCVVSKPCDLIFINFKS